MKNAFDLIDGAIPVISLISICSPVQTIEQSIDICWDGVDGSVYKTTL